MADSKVFNVQDYENVTKPRVMKTLTNQEIFDTVVVKLFEHKAPSLYVVETPRPGMPKEKAGDWGVVNFNVHGARSPILAFASQEEFRVLLSSVGWEALRDWDTDDLGMIRREELSEASSSYLVGKRVFDHLTSKGIDRTGMMLIEGLCDTFYDWASFVGNHWMSWYSNQYIHPHFAMKDVQFRARVNEEFATSFRHAGRMRGLSIASTKLNP